MINVDKNRLCESINRIANLLDEYGYIKYANKVDEMMKKISFLNDETKEDIANYFKKLTEEFERDPEKIIDEIRSANKLTSMVGIIQWIEEKIEHFQYQFGSYPHLKYLYDKLRNRIFLYAIENDLLVEEEVYDVEWLERSRKEGFANGLIKIAKRDSRSIVVDVDGTIFEKEKYEPGKFGKPITEVIELLAQIKEKKGYNIILYTARSWSEYNDLKDWIDRNNVGHLIDEIVMGKPIGVIYLDDKAVNPTEEGWEKLIEKFMEKE